MKRTLTVLVSTISIWVASASHATLIVGTASLDASQEVPAGISTSTATGVATVIADTAASTVSITLAVTGISLPDITFPGGGLAFDAAGPVHVHNAPAGANGVIILPFPNMVDYAATATGFELTSTVLLSAMAFDTFVAAMTSDSTYINVHTLAVGSGEIRGQIAVPAPGTLGLLALGVLGLALKRRKLTI